MIPNENEKESEIIGNPEVNFFATTNFRNKNAKFGIKLDDRRRHLYVVGKTGMGKTTMLENMVLNDIYAGHGVGVVDPHGDFAEKIIDYIPANRINDVVYFNPSDIDFPIGFNILESIDPRYRHLVASGLMGVFKKIWPDVWSARMEYILNNTLLALLEFPNTTLLGINRLLADNAYRKMVIKNLKDPVIKSFWETEFAGYNDRYKQEAVAPVQNKIGQFLSASVIRNIVAQVKSRINIREIMDTKKIFIMNLSKGRIGEDNSRLLGGMLITKIQLAAMERVDTPEKERKDFFLYVDEFQNFATESFSNILSEARKYRLDLTMAHQYMEQLDETVLAAVIGNVGTLVTFRVGSTDAEILAKEFAPTFIETDLVNLTKFQIYLKLMIDGVASQPFSANTLSPINISTHSAEKVIKVSRERYATSRENIEDKILRWTGMEAGGDGDTDADDSDEDYTEDEEGMPVKIEKKVVTPPPAPPPIKNHAPPPVKKPIPPPVGQPVSLVDTKQKGISLSQAVQTNRTSAIRHQTSVHNKQQSKHQASPPYQGGARGGLSRLRESRIPLAAGPSAPVPQPVSVIPPKPAPKNEPEKKIFPDKIVKINDDNT
ncbi:MAG: type IV secretion system DNA-binding domain-containing protein [Patescibacteria group bacterium]